MNGKDDFASFSEVDLPHVHSQTLARGAHSGDAGRRCRREAANYTFGLWPKLTRLLEHFDRMCVAISAGGVFRLFEGLCRGSCAFLAGGSFRPPLR